MSVEDTLTKTAESFRQQVMSLAADMAEIKKDRDDLWTLVNMMRESLQLGDHAPEYLAAAITLQLRRLEHRAAVQGWIQYTE